MADEVRTEGDNAQNSQQSTTPKPVPTPGPSSSTPPTPEPETKDEGRHSAAESEQASEPAAKEKHASLANLEGQGAPGDFSGFASSTEDPGAHPGDISNVTGRDQVTESGR